MPVPRKRSSERLGHSMGEVDTTNDLRTAASGGSIEQPRENPNWHPVALGWYKSLNMSGQRIWYEPSDWALAWVAADILTSLYNNGFSAGLLGEFNAMAAELMCTEGSRRKMRIELVKAGGNPDAEEAQSALDNIKGRLLQSSTEKP